MTLAVGLGLILMVTAAEARKLPVGAYIKTAKIEILSGDTVRYAYAQAMLDSLFLHYGPHAEGMFWMNQMMVDFIEKSGSLDGKKEYVELMVAYRDSLRFTCENKDINKKYRKDCNKLISKADSTGVKYWRDFYNEAIAQLDVIDEGLKEKDFAEDSATVAYWEKKLEATADSIITQLEMALLIDNQDHLPYFALGTLYEKLGKFKDSNEWLIKGMEFAEDRKPLLLQIAYNYVSGNSYCEAAVYFQEYVDLTPDSEKTVDDVSTMTNLAICYNNCKDYEKARAVNSRIVGVQPENTDALTSIGRYYNQMARAANDSANLYQSQNDEARKSEWRDIRRLRLDSSSTMFKRVFELKQDDIFAAEEYGVVCAILENYTEAAVAFTRLTELEPERGDHWTSLGDCLLNLKQFKESAGAYEKVVALEPDNRLIWERLYDIYRETRQNAKAAEAKKKLDNL
jgi:tetratricopeptide (TPR) repeat protein